MSRSSTYFISRVLLFLLIYVYASNSIRAQTETASKFGISFSSDISDSEIINQTPGLLDLGISVFELNDPISSQLIQSLSEYPVTILVRNDFKFLTSSEINNSDRIRTKLSPFIQEYASNSQVTGIGISSYSDEFTIEILQNLNTQVSDSIQVRFYQVGTKVSNKITSIVHSSSFSSIDDHDYYLFEAPFAKADLGIMHRILEAESELILMDWYWFSEAALSQSYFEETISIASKSGENLFPDTLNQSSSSNSEWPVIILVLLWVSLAIHLKSNPTYRPLIFRYFTFHRFFVDDIMRYRERSAAPGITLFVQHAYFTGLVTYIISVQFISDKGLEALFHHLPYLSVFGQNYFTLFVLAVISTLIISFTGLIWVYFPNKSMKHFSQVLNLYSWIFHLDFLIVSIMMILLITQGSGSALLILGGLHILCWILAFILSAFDSSKYLTTGRFGYFLRTIGIFIPLLITLTILFLLSGYSYDILRLAFSL